MGRSLGGLVVNLALNAAEYTTGLTAAEARARKFAKNIDDGIRTAANAATIAVTALGVAGLAAFKAIDSLAKQAGNFQDLAEMTGASAEGLASFAVSASVADVEMSTVADASIKLTKALTDVDDESKAAGAALAALGIPIKDFKALAPEAQIEAVAKALAGFEEGAGKTAVAVALFGKSGAQLLPFLKELANEGGRQVILTQRQIELADAYADKQAKSRAELQLYAQALATEALSAVTAFQDATKEVIKELLGLDSTAKSLGANTSVSDFALEGARSLGYLAEWAIRVADNFRIAGITIGALGAQISSGSFAAAKAIKAEADADIARINARKSFVDLLESQIDRQRKIAVGMALISKGNEDRNDRLARKPTLNFSGAESGGKGAKAAAERVSEAQRYAEQLEKQLQGTLELSTAETALVAIYDMKAKGMAGLTPQIEAQILDYARQIDFSKEAAKAETERTRAAEEAVKSQQAISQATARWAQDEQRATKAIGDSNDRLVEQIAFVKGGQEALDRLVDAKNADASASLRRRAANLEALDADQQVIDAIRAQAAEIERMRSLSGDLRLAETMKKEADAIAELKGEAFDIAGRAVEDLIVNGAKASDVLKALEKDLVSFITRQALLGLKNSLLGGGGGPTLFDLLPKLFGLLGGGSAASQIPGSFTGPSFGSFAAGGVSRGGLALVGEQGPELVHMSSGSRVYSARDTSQMLSSNGGQGITINQTIMPGADTRTARQIAKGAGRAASSALRRG